MASCYPCGLYVSADGSYYKVYDRSSKELVSSSASLRCNKKLLFCLCRTCVFEQNTRGKYQHFSDADRAISGTWVIDKVGLAVENWYKILEIHVVYEYQYTQYNPETGHGIFFADYINTFLNLRLRLVGVLAGFEPRVMKTDTLIRFGKANESYWTKIQSKLMLQNVE